MKKNLDVLIVCSPGGHKYVSDEIFDKTQLNTVTITSLNNLRLFEVKKTDKNTFSIIESNRDLKIFIQILLSIKLIIKFNPKIILSTGAGIAIPFFIVGKIFNKKLVYVESASRVSSLSITGRICYYFVNKFYVRSNKLNKKYKKTIYINE